jgi:hypothetical protein
MRYRFRFEDTDLSNFLVVWPVPILPFFMKNCKFVSVRVTELGGRKINSCKFFSVQNFKEPFPVAAPSKAWVCGRSFDALSGSNLTRGMGVCIL